MLRLASFAVITAVLLITPVHAAHPANTNVAINSAYDLNEVICKMVPPPIGSRLGGGKVCATRRAWEERRKRDRELTEDAQGRNMRGPTGWW
jgi:hypothetical protein